MKFRPFLIAGLALIILFSVFSAALGFDWNFLWKPKPDQKKIAAGLKEALRVGTDNSVQLTGRLDGFYKNPQIKIPLPVQFQKIEKFLRRFGLEEQVDEFILSLNRAAEQAAPAARDIFWNAIKEMTFDDAIAIFKGSDMAATDYFKAKTSEELIKAFTPVVSRATEEAEVTKIYKELTHEIQKIKLLNLETVDIDEYVVTKTLDGLFYVLGEEEKKIRKDPEARVTELLKDVFGD